MLDDRKRRILNTVVYRFITTGMPVGSSVISKTLDLGISPATIRNEMSKLEEMGYIYQPHTSAGRVPTDKGYRFYVDELAGMTVLPESEREALLALFSAKAHEMEDMLKETSSVLSRLTRSTALVAAPRFRRSLIKHVDLIQLQPNVSMLVLITDTGGVEKRIIEGAVALGVSTDEIQEYLNRALCGKALQEVKAGRKAVLAGFERGDLGMVLDAVQEMAASEEQERIYWAGALNLFKGVDLEASERVEELMDALEKQYFILSMLNEVLVSKGVTVRIGFENPAEELRDLSLVASSYSLGGENVGTVGILGPTRMDYARVIPMVDFTARLLSRALGVLRG
ncbi:MAG: heat-inducible transcriptional repressor HrcA [Candidatus Geothermincolia bacterium]